MLHRKVPKIPVPTIYVIIPDPERFEMIWKALSRLKTVLAWNLWSIESSVEWTRDLERKVQKNNTNGRFENMGKLVCLASPYDISQARTLHKICSEARVIYIGKHLKSPTADIRERTAAIATNYLIKHGHRHEVIEPATLIENILQRITAGPAHLENLTDTVVEMGVRTFNSASSPSVAEMTVSDR